MVRFVLGTGPVVKNLVPCARIPKRWIKQKRANRFDQWSYTFRFAAFRLSENFWLLIGNKRMSKQIEVNAVKVFRLRSNPIANQRANRTQRSYRPNHDWDQPRVIKLAKQTIEPSTSRVFSVWKRMKKIKLKLLVFQENFSLLSEFNKITAELRIKFPLNFFFPEIPANSMVISKDYDLSRERSSYLSLFSLRYRRVKIDKD